MFTCLLLTLCCLSVCLCCLWYDCSFGASIKMYGMAAWLWAKPMVVAGFMKGGWLAGLSICEWSAGRAYSINCIGEGLTGWYDHIWSMGSPACVICDVTCGTYWCFQ